MNKELTELYSNYLLRSFGATTATGLSDMLGGEISHDRITRFLSEDGYDSRTLWKHVKPMVREIQQPDGALIFDDTIQKKPHTDENDIVNWHFDHSKSRTVKGINILNCVYHAHGVTLPAAYEIIRKPIVFEDENSGRLKRRSEVSKNELMRRMLRVCQQNSLEYSHVLADSWFSSRENMSFIHDKLGKEFIIALKSNRTAALSYEAKLQGGFQRIDTLELPEGQPVRGWLRGLNFRFCCFAGSLRTEMAAQGLCIWLAASWTVMARPSKRSIRKGGKWRRFTRRSSLTQRLQNRRRRRFGLRPITASWPSTRPVVWNGSV